LWRILPAILAFTLLAIQITIPWTVPHFVTQDGPSHLYTAIVAKNLLFHQQRYAALYSFNPRLIPNWASTILFALSASIVGAGHAEQLMMSIVVCLGFFSISYAILSLSPKATPWTPLSNFILETWFLWIGFYNFYLGMVLVPLAIGFYVRRNGRLTWRAAAVLSVGLVILFFVHLIAAAVCVLVLAVIAFWMHIANSADWRTGMRQTATLFGAMAPVVFLAVIFAFEAGGGAPVRPNVLEAWHKFPMHVFITAPGAAGAQLFLWPAVLALIIIAALAMRSCEWQTAKGGLAVAAIALFLVYLIVPDSGLGGNQVRVRFAWVVFLLGILLVSSTARLQPLRTPIAIFVAACLAFNLTATTRGIFSYSRAVEDYLGTLRDIRPGSTIIRVRFPTPDLVDRYGYRGLGRDPLFHLDAYVASQLGCLDLTDYQGPTTDFPVIFNSLLDHTRQFQLLGLENPSQDENADLDSIRHDLPVPIDYAIVVADDSSPAPAVAKVTGNLDSGMRLAAQSPAPPFVRVYQRTGPH
jgi:hypothetical protein